MADVYEILLYQGCYLYGVNVGVCPGVRPEGWLKWFAPPSGGVERRGHIQYPAFALGSSEVAVGLLGLFLCFAQ